MNFYVRVAMWYSESFYGCNNSILCTVNFALIVTVVLLTIIIIIVIVCYGSRVFEVAWLSDHHLPSALFCADATFLCYALPVAAWICFRVGPSCVV